MQSDALRLVSHRVRRRWDLRAYRNLGLKAFD